MKHLFIVHGIKGGVGKSTVAIALAGHMAKVYPGTDLALYDLEGAGGDLIAHFPNAVAVTLAADDLGGILDDLLRSDGPSIALVDTPANAHLDRWMIDCGPALAVGDGLLKIHVYWVVDGTARSAAALAAAVECWEREQLLIELTVLRNLGASSLFQFDTHPVGAWLTKNNVRVLDIPPCDEVALAEATATRVGFHAYAQSARPNTVYSRRATVATWLGRLAPLVDGLPVPSAP